MSLSTIQILSFRQLLEQLVTPATVSHVNAQRIHVYLFEQPIDLFIPADSALAMAISYLRQIIVSQGIDNLDDLLFYFEKKSKKIDYFLEQLVSGYEEQPHDLPALNEDWLHPERSSGRLSHLFVTKANELVNCISNMNNLKRTYSRITQDLDAKTEKPGKCRLFKYSVPKNEESGNHYIGHFSENEQLGYVFVMKFALRPKYMEIGEKSQKTTLAEWIIQYFNARETPDYDMIINVIRKEQPIKDRNFKFLLFEWLIFSKVIISGCGTTTEDAAKADLLSDISYYPALKNQHLCYYSGHGVRRWITNLFEEKLTSKKWRILKRSADLFWLTSDNPGFLIHIGEMKAGKKEAQLVHSLTEIRLDTVLYYPLSKDYCLRIEPNAALDREGDTDDSAIEYEHSSKEEVDFVNMQTIFTHLDVVIAPQRKMLSKYIAIYR